MKSNLKLSIILVAVCTWAGLWLPAASLPTTARDANLLGTFIWSNEPLQKHEMHAKLTAIGTNEWQVVWDFDWKHHPMTFTGTVTGDLHNGSITGTGDAPDGKRHFAFDGLVKDGAIEFEHYEVTHGKRHTGTGEMRVVN